ncbi:hypothetical protein TREMEDRAFT_46104 [Tremella mesenterica DSM 1558]|nr:uncharacterized protein TREMEDRAFT_46104 [Tremella mesenterica DSM 1558]EIW65876.1 hypothetical protein TREMEDRAFT_46104 [Tremella mesenterica DSM 1558]
MFVAAILLGVYLTESTHALPLEPYVDTAYPYKGPKIPVGDWVNQSPSFYSVGGFPRLTEPPAVLPHSPNPTNNINVISMAYMPNGMHIHFQTPFGIGGEPCVNWGTSIGTLDQTTKGWTRTYDRTPSCSEVDAVTQCSEFFHEVSITGLQPATQYFYQIPGGNGTTPSPVMTFTTGLPAGDKTSFSVAYLNDMGYTNAKGTHDQLIQAVAEGVSFLHFGGDISYADDWYSGVLPCDPTWDLCYNGTGTVLPGPAPIPVEYDEALPKGEIPNQGGPFGGDISVVYESNWDLWQNWMAIITKQVPLMIMPGNHEAACAEFDGPNNELSALLDNNVVNGTQANSTLNYYSCPPSQRNFTAYSNRFYMPGDETGGRGNMWYSFDFGLAHFIAIDGETDFPSSPEWPFAADIKGNETHPTPEQTYPTDSGPFGYINGSIKEVESYEQYQWLQSDLASVDRSKTPWVFAMSHRPMYSSQTATYQEDVRNAFEALLLQYKVDAYMSGHIHWYERLYPLGRNGTLHPELVIDENTYVTGTGQALAHMVNGMAGNIESHSILSPGQTKLNITNVLNYENFGYSKLTVHNETTATWQYYMGDSGIIGDTLTMVKGQ